MFTAKVERKRHMDVGKLAAALRGPSKIKVGFPAGDVDADLVLRAVVNEFGSKGSGKGFKTPRGGGFGGPIPERPFMRNAMRANRGKYQKFMGAGARQIIHGSSSMLSILRGLGVLAQGDIVNEIESMKSPPNAPLTILLKGSSNPLVDSGAMAQGVTWKVDD